MAAGTTEESVLDRIIQGHLECLICCDHYQDPKMLHCSHSFCLKCLQELKHRQNPTKNKIKCPLCERVTNLPEGGVTKLANNYALTSLMEEITKQKQLLQGEGLKVECQACDDGNEAISRCVDCQHHLCQECHKAHTRMVNMKAHKIVALTELQGKGNSPTEMKNISKCELHPHQNLCFYCNTCEQLICKLCATTSHKEPIHTFFDFKTAIDICQQEASERNRKAQKCDADISKSWESLRSRLSILLAETNSQISHNAERKIIQIRQEENQLKQMVTAMYRRKDKTLAEMVFAEQTTGKLHDEMNEASRYEVLKLRQELLHVYKDVVEDRTEDVTHQLSFIGFNDNEDKVQLGKILQREKWKLLSESNVIGRAIAALSTGDILVLNKTHKKLTKLSSNGEVQGVHIFSTCQLDGEDSMKQPSAFAVNKDDQLIILMDSDTEIFSKEYKFLSKFTPGEVSWGTPTCLAVDDSGLIAVGFQDKGEISLHNPDGSLISTLPAPMIETYLTINNRGPIYTSYQNKKLMCIDFMGNHIFEVNTGEGPYGLCCDKAGDIYVTVDVFQGMRRCYEIKHYSAEGKYIETVGNIGYDSRLSDITYVPDGKYAVTTGNSTRVYHRV